MPNFFTTSGRLSRLGWWFNSALLFCLCFVLWILSTWATVMFGAFAGTAGLPNTSSIFATIIFVWTIGQSNLNGQRLHDLNKSAWTALVFMLPGLGTGMMIGYLGFWSGTQGANRFGPNPRLAAAASVTEEPPSASMENMQAALDRRLAASVPAPASVSRRPGSNTQNGIAAHLAGRSNPHAIRRPGFGQR